MAQQDTEEKRDDVTEIRVPRVIELLDIREQSNSLVRTCIYSDLYFFRPGH